MKTEKIEKMPEDTLVCHCNGVTLGEIIEAAEKGALDVESLMDATDAGSVCGLCTSCEEDEADERKLHLTEILKSVR